MVFWLGISMIRSGCKLGCCTMNAIAFQIPEESDACWYKRSGGFEATAGTRSFVLESGSISLHKRFTRFLWVLIHHTR